MANLIDQEPRQISRRHQLRRMTAGVASPADKQAFEATIVSMIRDQIPDPATQDKAIAMALDRAGHIRSISELAQLVSAVKQDTPLTADNWATSEVGGHYRDDGTDVDERGDSGSGSSSDGEFMSSTSNIFSNKDGSAKDPTVAWNGWAYRFGTGTLEGTHTKSKDLFDGMMLGRQASDNSNTQAKIAELAAAARVKGGEFVSRDGKQFWLTDNQAVECYANDKPLEKLKLIGDPKANSDDAKVRSCLEKAITEGNGDINDPRNKKAADSITTEGNALRGFLSSHADASPQKKPDAPNPGK